MASAASPKRMVSSVFITLASPHQATASQHQPAPKAVASPARRKPSTGERVDTSDLIHTRRQKKEAEHSPSTRNIKDQRKVEVPSLAPEGPAADKHRAITDTRPALVQPTPPDASVTKDPSLPPPPPSEKKLLSQPSTSDQQTIYDSEVLTLPSTEISSDASNKSQDVCGFCRKPVSVSGAVIEALNRIYHDACFQCRSCQTPLAGNQYYNKAGIPLCEECYQASLELCWACGEVIVDYVMRALERAYHPSCFICATCKQKIGEQSFAQGEVGEVYCLQDYYRKYAPKCQACSKLIIPKEDGTDCYTVQCLGHSYHENCYRCEVCAIQLSPEPNERGCFPLEGKMLCKPCHLDLVSTVDNTDLNRPNNTARDRMQH